MMNVIGIYKVYIFVVCYNAVTGSRQGNLKIVGRVKPS